MTIPTPVKPKYEKLRETLPVTRVTFAGSSEVGQVRSVNQDSFWVDYVENIAVPKSTTPPATISPDGDPSVDDTNGQDQHRQGFLAIVADGMGGHKAGEIASQKAVAVMKQQVANLADHPPVALAKAVQAANQEVYGYALDNPDQKGMGTTLSVLYIDDQVGLVTHIGDSRAYLIRDNTIRQLTQDHSWVAERVRLGLISEEEARNHRWRNVITNALGANPEIKLDVMNFTVQTNDRFLLCSDGITTLIEDSDIARIVSQFPPQQAVEELIDRANDGGSPDNVTAVVVEVEHVETTPKVYALQENYTYKTVKIKDTLSGIAEIRAAYPTKATTDPVQQTRWQTYWHTYKTWIIGIVSLLLVLLLLLALR